MTGGRTRTLVLAVGWALLIAAAPIATAGSEPAAKEERPPGVAERVILLVLEGVAQSSLQSAEMSTLARLAQEGAVTWGARNPTADLQLPSMATLFTGLPVDKHGITWNEFDFARGFPRAPTLFDYMDLSGGKDTAIFFMDESLYQLARPEPYIDYQICGALRPECTTDTMVKYIRDYMVKGASGEGYGRRIVDLPHLLIVHLPEAGRAGRLEGWTSEAYRDALTAVDRAMHAILDLYQELGLLDHTTVIVTALNGVGSTTPRENGSEGSRIPWIAWGYGIKPGHVIGQPVSLIDVGATIMRTLGLQTYTEWESRPIEEVFVSSTTRSAPH